MRIVCVVPEQPSSQQVKEEGCKNLFADLPGIYFLLIFFGVNEELWLNARLYQTNLMQEFFFEVGLQDILFRNHPAPPLKISMVSSTLKNELSPVIYEINE